MASSPVPATWSDPEVERRLLDAVSVDVAAWPLIERFSTLVREAGSDDELAAFGAITERLDAWGIPSTLHRPTLLISLPRGAELRVTAPEAARREVHAKVPAFAASTGPTPIEGELVYLPTGYATTVADFFASDVRRGDAPDLRGKIVITEGRSAPQKVADVAALGALAQIYANPGTLIHEGICTTIWGAPDLDSVERLPTAVVVTVNRADGAALIETARAGGARVAIRTAVDTGWRPCPVLVAEIRGAVVPDEFVLLHGHLDSWHVGVGDNAVGDATMLEVARLLAQPEHRPARTVRIAWWTGHSQGRYAGSTWYADTFAVDLAANCVAQVNCDSPGCRWATEYRDVAWMPECEALARGAIRAATGQGAQGSRPLRAGDYAFNNLGISGVLMGSSEIPEAVLKEKGFHVVGGCGGNIEWHTEADTLEIADRENLQRDTRVYALTVQRLANAPVHPLDFVAAADDWLRTLDRYQQTAGDRFNLGPAVEATRAMRTALERFTASAAALADRRPDDPELRRVNRTLRRIGRIMVGTHFSREGQFRQDPACPVPPLPDLAPVDQLAAAAPGSFQDHVLQTHLTRGRNRVVWAAQQVMELAEG